MEENFFVSAEKKTFKGQSKAPLIKEVGKSPLDKGGKVKPS